MKIAIGSDHGGYKLKEFLKKELAANYEVVDYGTENEESADYPIFASRVGAAVAGNQCDYGIAICTSGIGVSISANKVQGVRAALVCEPKRAEMARRHNNANVICFGQDYIDNETALKATKIFLSTEFEGDKPGQERHRRRVEEIAQIEENQ